MIKSKVGEEHKNKQKLTFPVIMINSHTPELIVLFQAPHEGVPLSVPEGCFFSVGKYSEKFSNPESRHWEIFTGTLELSNE